MKVVAWVPLVWKSGHGFEAAAGEFAPWASAARTLGVATMISTSSGET